MDVRQIVLRDVADQTSLAELRGFAADLVLVFGSVGYFHPASFLPELQAMLPSAVFAGCSTAGEISGDGVSDHRCVVTAIQFDRTPLSTAATQLQGMADSFAAGARLGAMLAGRDVRAVLLFGPGVNINGSALIDGLTGVLGESVPVTGGLAGDGGAFVETWTLGPNGVASDQVIAVGLGGDALRFAHGSFGGWEAFGPARKITRSAGNILYELDGEPALAVYKRYLGEHAADLPASGLLFPFAMLGEDHSSIGLIRTILGIDESAGALVLAGEIDPQGYLRLMHASTDRLVSGAEAAARAAQGMFSWDGQQLAILVSCVGRKLVMGDRVDEEVEAVSDVLGQFAKLTGFYSYGEISPFAPVGSCKLHNQTMTITCLGEA